MLLSTQPALPPVEEENPIFNRRRLPSIADDTQFRAACIAFWLLQPPPIPSPLSPSVLIAIPFDAFNVRDVFAEVFAPCNGRWWSMLIERDTTTAIKRDT